MAFIKFFIFLLKKFEKVEKTGIISTKFSLRCTPSVILGVDYFFDGRTPFNLIFLSLEMDERLEIGKVLASAPAHWYWSCPFI